MENPSALGELITLVLVVVFMLGGMDLITRVHPLLHRCYRWLVRTLVLRPLRWGLRQLGRSAEWLLRWSARQLGRFLLFLARLIGRGIRWTWVRLTA